jgi:hypothetical protein
MIKRRGEKSEKTHEIREWIEVIANLLVGIGTLIAGIIALLTYLR